MVENLLYVRCMYYLDDYWSKAYGENYIKPRLIVYTDSIDLSVDGRDKKLLRLVISGG